MIRVLYEDDDVVAVDKPEGIAVIPERRPAAPSLLSELTPRYPPKLFVVHRLDKEVSGVLLFARHASAHRHLNQQFSRRLVWKIYVLVVHGTPAAESGVITTPLREFGSGRVAADPEHGKACTTEFWLKETVGAYSVISASPRTGRRHQIRAHFYSLGHPVVGDLRYGDRALQRKYNRLMLHARRLEVPLPSGLQTVIESPVPRSFADEMERIRSLPVHTPGSF